MPFSDVMLADAEPTFPPEYELTIVALTLLTPTRPPAVSFAVTCTLAKDSVMTGSRAEPLTLFHAPIRPPATLPSAPAAIAWLLYAALLRLYTPQRVMDALWSARPTNAPAYEMLSWLTVVGSSRNRSKNPTSPVTLPSMPAAPSFGASFRLEMMWPLPRIWLMRLLFTERYEPFSTAPAVSVCTASVSFAKNADQSISLMMTTWILSARPSAASATVMPETAGSRFWRWRPLPT